MRKTVLMVTHDVNEAVYLSNRICVMSARPGQIVEEFAVDLDRTVPRETLMLSDAFNRIRNEVWLAVRRQSLPAATRCARPRSACRRPLVWLWRARAARAVRRCFGRLVSASGLVDPAFLPSPRRGRRGAARSPGGGRDRDNLLVTLFRALAGLALGAVAGVSLGLMMARSVAFRAYVTPIVGGTYSLPKSALVPLFILWFGIGRRRRSARSFSPACCR